MNTKPEIKYICGKELKKIRKEHGDNITDFAKDIGYSVSFIDQIERGKKAIPYEFIEKVCQYYHLNDKDRDMLFTKRIESNPIIRIVNKDLTPEKIALLQSQFVVQ